MQILSTKSAGCWHRRMRCLLLCATETNSPCSSSSGGNHYSQLARPEAPSAATAGTNALKHCHAHYRVVATTRCHHPCRTCATTTELAQKGFQWLYRESHPGSLVKKVPMNFSSQQKGYLIECQRWLSDFLQMKGNGQSLQAIINQDLRRFLEEVCDMSLSIQRLLLLLFFVIVYCFIYMQLD